MNLSIIQNYILGLSFLLSNPVLATNDKPFNFQTSFLLWEECDLCGCATSGGGMGFSSLQNNNFIGIRYIHQDFKSRDGIFNNSPIINENFATTQLWAKKNITEKWSLSAVVPYSNLKRTHTQRPSERVSGLGDITLITWYHFSFFKKTEENEAVFATKTPSNHQLQVGIGVKLPTGEFRQELTNGINPGFQVGTGSTDIVLSSIYNYTKEKWGFSSNLSYFVKTENSDNYRFGNQVSLSSRAFLPFGNETLAYFPFLGITADHYNEVEEFGEKINGTDGHLINFMLGTEIAYKGFMLGGNFSVPIQQNLVSGDVTAKNRLEVYINFLF